MILSVAFAAALELRVRATVNDDLRTIGGTIEANEEVAYVDLQRWLPMPEDDLGKLRTFPGRPDEGGVRWSCRERSCSFQTELPRRYGDIGALPGKGLWANGAWYPQPVNGTEPRIATWDVEVTLPADTVGVLNGVVGLGTIAWTGTTDRLALAVLPGDTPPVEERIGDQTVVFVGRAAARPAVRGQMRTLIEVLSGGNDADRLVVVASRDRRRLATAGPGMVYLSDRTFRVSPGLGRFHAGAVMRSLAEADSPRHSTWDRAFSAAALWPQGWGPSVEKALGWAAWNPIIDQLLTDGTLPFYDDIFDSAYPPATDPLLAIQGRRAPRAAALQRQDHIGHGTTDLAGEGGFLAMEAGAADVIDAARRSSVPADILEGWLHPAEKPADYQVRLHGTPPTVTRLGSQRDPEPVVIDIDGDRVLWIPDSMNDHYLLPEGAKQVTVDPDAHVRDADRSNNRAPSRWSTVATGWVDEINATDGTFEVWGNLVFRRHDDTRNLYLVGADHDRQDLVSAYVGYVRYLGPLLDRRAREHRIVFTAGPSLLDPAFRPTDRGDVAIGASLAYAWETRAADTYAMSGHRFSLSGGGGFIPGADETWAGASIGHVQLVPLHPRHVLAFRGKAGWASGDVEHRLLSLGGSSAVRAVDGAALVGNERLVGSFEYRAAVVRDASVPVGLGWLSEIQLAPGIEAGEVWTDGADDPAVAVGATGGVYILVDLLGARPTLVGVSAGFPLFVDGFPEGVPESVPQVYLSFDHAF